MLPPPPKLALSTAGISQASTSSTDPRALITQVKSMGFRAITLDATMPNFRPRELTRSARRDLAAILRRAELELAGLDLFIPPEHFTDPAHAHRAIDALAQSLELASELAALIGSQSRAIVSINLPSSNLPNATQEHIINLAQQWGASAINHMPPSSQSSIKPSSQSTSQSTDPSSAIPPELTIPAGLDPASDLIAGLDPLARVHTAAALRLSDANQLGRCPVGVSGSRLDLQSYAAACIIADHQWVTLDVRALQDPAHCASTALSAWNTQTNPFAS